MQAHYTEFIKYATNIAPNEPEFIQAVKEVMADVIPYTNAHMDHVAQARILERMIEPERTISFRVTWIDDQHQVQINRGYRVQMNSAIGPYKGGLRFSPTVNQSVLKFLAFEQVFKNSLTGLPLGGGKGGADFDPKGRSDNEIMRFCQSYMTELYRHIGPETDVPAGDIGVGAKEIGYLFGQYKRISNDFTGVITGKGTTYGGSFLRPEATGYGLIYFVQEMLSMQEMQLKGKTIVLSGAGNVSYYTAEKAISLGAKVITFSNSSGTLHDPAGFSKEKLQLLARLGRNLKAYLEYFPEAEYRPDEKPWSYPCDIALPCACQNELDLEDFRKLQQGGCICIAEGANMPVTEEALQSILESGILYCPGKAANAGGVAVSGLEMAQNRMNRPWDSAAVDTALQEIMHNIHGICVRYGKTEEGRINYAKGANIGGFIKVAQAMLAQGVV